jgi:hypothetical protein
MAFAYTDLLNYCLYSFNDSKGRVPFLDDSTSRSALAARILAATTWQ